MTIHESDFCRIVTHFLLSCCLDIKILKSSAHKNTMVSASAYRRQRAVLEGVEKLTLPKGTQLYHATDDNMLDFDGSRPLWTTTEVGEPCWVGTESWRLVLTVNAQFLVFVGGHLPIAVSEAFGGIRSFDQFARVLLRDHPWVNGYIEKGIYGDPEQMDVVLLRKELVSHLL